VTIQEGKGIVSAAPIRFAAGNAQTTPSPTSP
jgi:hypothetical protein